MTRNKIGSTNKSRIFRIEYWYVYGGYKPIPLSGHFLTTSNFPLLSCYMFVLCLFYISNILHYFYRTLFCCFFYEVRSDHRTNIEQDRSGKLEVVRKWTESGIGYIHQKTSVYYKRTHLSLESSESSTGMFMVGINRFHFLATF